MRYLLGSLLWYSLVIFSGDWMGIMKSWQQNSVQFLAPFCSSKDTISPRATSRNSMKMSPQCLRLSLTSFSRWAVYCMHVCICVYACVCVCMCEYVSVCMHVCVHMCVYACVCTYVCVRMCVYVCVCTHVCMHMCMHVYVWKCEVWSPCFVPHLGMDFVTYTCKWSEIRDTNAKLAENLHKYAKYLQAQNEKVLEGWAILCVHVCHFLRTDTLASFLAQTGIDPSSCAKSDLDRLPVLKQFLNHCCQTRHYSFCIQKCGSSDCQICKPPRLPKEVFETLYYISDPICDGNVYKPFSDVYGTITTVKDWSSLNSSAEKLSSPWINIQPFWPICKERCKNTSVHWVWQVKGAVCFSGTWVGRSTRFRAISGWYYVHVAWTSRTVFLLICLWRPSNLTSSVAYSYDRTCVELHRQSALMSFVVTVAVVTISYLQMKLQTCTHFPVTGSS